MPGMRKPPFSVFPVLLQESASRFPLELSAPQVPCSKAQPAGFAQADSFLPFRSQLKCHFLRGSLDLCHSSHPRLFFPLGGTYHMAQQSHFAACFLVLLPLGLSSTPQGTLSGITAPSRQPLNIFD